MMQFKNLDKTKDLWPKRAEGKRQNVSYWNIIYY